MLNRRFRVIGEIAVEFMALHLLHGNRARQQLLSCEAGYTELAVVAHRDCNSGVRALRRQLEALAVEVDSRASRRCGDTVSDRHKRFCCETLFNIEIGDFYRIFLEIRNRKKSRTQFLDKLKDKIIKMMDELDK